MREALIVGAARSPIGSLPGVSPPDLLSDVVRAALSQAPGLDAAGTDDLYVGSAYGKPDTAARVAAKLGLESGPTAMVSGLCTSSMQTTRMAVHAIRAGEGDAYISAGVDSARKPAVRSPCMRGGARHTPSRFRVSRYERDEFRVRSHLLAEQAITNGFYRREIVPVRLPDGRVADRDEGPIAGASYEMMRSHPAAVRLRDGAAATVIVSDAYAKELDLTPLARVIATSVGSDVVESARRALFHAGLCTPEVDLWEINESSAAETITAYRALRIDVDRVNIHGGALALGLAVGMTGARIVTTLLNGLRTNDLEIGLAAVGTPSGQAMALVLERLN
ncbi:beta-ketoacyl synthase N-terminal-like domain-containing protein [Paractinoplanes globisporus]|uniref:Beta-ketoacyl synthase N-terminal-like domain-containing protein n=1 Tax=Paractinoplanes globisporus TaxID=113565 RepID=A0ABW6WFQ9_9ACTN|nr:beta-ketoacyl synthase N-terminal-like domain-containing protein [Actinoplanes globisporus]